MTVYADVLFLVNGSMDLLTLIFASRITHRPVLRWRLMLSSAVGGCLGTCLALLRVHGLLSSLLNLAVMTAMTYLAFGRRRLLHHAMVVCGSGTVLGGIMTALLSMGEPIVMDYGSAYPGIFLVCTAGAWVFTRLFSSSAVKRSVQVTFRVNEVSRTFTALLDSGCFLTEPISGDYVITVAEYVLEELAVRVKRGDPTLRLRLIPMKTAAGEGLLYGFVPDFVSVDGEVVRAVIAVDREKRAGYDGIVPAGLTGNYLIHSIRRGDL